MPAMAGPSAGAAKIQIPRWIQLVGLPLLLLLLWVIAGAAGHVVFLFLLAAIIALGSVVVDQTKSSANRVNDYFTVEHGHPARTRADLDVDRFQHWLDTHRLGGIAVPKQGHDLVRQIRKKDVTRYTGDVINFVEGAAIGTIKFLV